MFPSTTGALTALPERLCNENLRSIGCPSSTGVVTVAVQRTRPPRMRRLELVVLLETTDPCECDVGLPAW
jgi:hypothetical protein